MNEDQEQVRTDVGGPESLSDSETQVPAVSTERHIFVHAMIAVVFAMFIGIVTLLFFQWLWEPVPNSLIIVTGDSSFDGSTVAVTSPSGKSLGVVRLEEANKLTARFVFAAETGSYTIKVFNSDGSIATEGDIHDIRRGQMLQIPLKKPATAPSR